MDQTQALGMTMAGGNQQSGQQEAESEQDQIQFIVEQVNNILSRQFSLVDFDELPPLHLLQLLSDLFGELAPQARVDFGQVSFEQGCLKLLEFLLRTLRYKVPPMIQHRFQTDFTVGDKATLYPVLYWVLKKMPENRQRVYLARFIGRIDIPEDLRQQDDGIRELYQLFETRKTDFIEVHKRVSALREVSADPTEASRRIRGLESERDQLQASITAAQKKLNQVPARDALVSACKSLRAEQEDAEKLRVKMEEQQRAMADSQRKARDAANRLQAVRRDIQENRLDAVVQRMSDDLHANRILLDQQLPRELNERRVKVAALQKLTSEPPDLQALQQELNGLNHECQILQGQVAKRNAPMEDGTNILSMKQSVQRVVAKKTEAVNELTSLTDKRNTIQEVVREKQTELDRLRNSKILKGEDFKRYSNQVRSKTAAANNMKRRLNDLRGEFGVLQYTEKLLKDRHEELQGDLSEIEERLGAKGYVARAEHLNKVGEEKAKVEQVKAQTLEELSVVVQSINKEIHQKRDELAPRIVELRNARNQAQTVEQEWEEKRSAYEYQQGMLMQEVNKLEAEVGGMAEEVRTNESVYHRLHSQLALLKIQQHRVADEKEFRAGSRTLDPTARTYTQLYHSSTENLEQKNKGLQRRRRDIDENHEAKLQQVEWFTSLRKLLEAKLQSLNQDGGRAPVTSIDHDIHQIMGATSTQGGVNRLVLGTD